jgi:ADP-heptose:LPS heptosyltransferase
VLSAGEPCAPCFARTCALGHTDCLGKITVAAVLDAALALLAGAPA